MERLTTVDPPVKPAHYPPLPAAIPDRAADHDAVTVGAESHIATAGERRGVEVIAPTSIGRPRIVSSAHGPFRHLLLWYPAFSAGEFDIGPVFDELLRRLPTSTRVTIAAHPDAVESVRVMADRARPESTTSIVPVPEWLAFSVWAEDAFVVVEDLAADPPTVHLLEPRSFPRFGDPILAEHVAPAIGAEVAQVPLMFQGGNILIGDDFVLIGSDYLTSSVAVGPDVFDDFPPPGERDAQEAFVAARFREAFDPDRAVHFLRSTPRRPPDPEPRVLPDGRVFVERVDGGRGQTQPIFHIDMFISLAGRDSAGGRYRVMVGDPRQADELLGRRSFDHDLAEEYDEIADQLAGVGFDVIRTPLPLAYVDELGSAVGQDGTPIEVLQRHWYAATSNNCLVQIDGTSREVWLPTYAHGAWASLSVTDDATRSTWERLGFTCHQLGDFHPFASRFGALHCIKKYLTR